MTIYNAHYRFAKGGGDKLGGFETTYDAGEAISADIARRLDLDIEVVKNIQRAFLDYLIFATDESADDIEARINHALSYSVMR